MTKNTHVLCSYRSFWMMINFEINQSISPHNYIPIVWAQTETFVRLPIRIWRGFAIFLWWTVKQQPQQQQQKRPKVYAPLVLVCTQLSFVDWRHFPLFCLAKKTNAMHRPSSITAIIFFLSVKRNKSIQKCVYTQKHFLDNAIAQWLCFFSAQFFLHTLSLSLDIVVYAEIFMTRVEYRCHFAFIVFFSMSLSAFIIINVPHKHNLILALHVMRMNFVLCCFVIVQIFDNLCWFGLCDRRTYRNVSFKSIIFVWQTWWFAYFLQKIEILLHEENSVHIQNIMNSHPIFGVRCENPKECLFTFNWYLTIF